MSEDKRVEVKAQLEEDRVLARFAFLRYQGSAEAWLLDNGVGAKV